MKSKQAKQNRFVLIERIGSDFVRVKEITDEDLLNLPKILQNLPAVTSNGLLWKREVLTIQAARLLKQELAAIGEL